LFKYNGGYSVLLPEQMKKNHSRRFYMSKDNFVIEQQIKYIFFFPKNFPDKKIKF